MKKVNRFDENRKLDSGARFIYYYVDENGCYINTSHRKDRDGYARIYRDGTEWLMHRYIYTITFGDIPEGLVVRHKCDQPSCNNPEHLEIGTQAENMRDMILRGRKRKSGKRLLYKEKIKIASVKNRTIQSLAKEYEVSHKTIVDIRKMFREDKDRKLAYDKKLVPITNTRKKDHSKK